MYAVGSKLPFPGRRCCTQKNKYEDETLLLSLTDNNDVRFFSSKKEALAFAGSDMLELHSSPRTSLPLGMRAVFEVTEKKDSFEVVRITKVVSYCLPHKPEKWHILNFDTSRSIYKNNHTFEGYIYPIFFPDHINLMV